MLPVIQLLTTLRAMKHNNRWRFGRHILVKCSATAKYAQYYEAIVDHESRLRTHSAAKIAALIYLYVDISTGIDRFDMLDADSVPASIRLEIDAEKRLRGPRKVKL